MSKKIYESPDGGHTVYERTVGESQRRLIKEDSYAVYKNWKADATRKWAHIIDDAELDPVLKDMMNQVESYWKLKHG